MRIAISTPMRYNRICIILRNRSYLEQALNIYKQLAEQFPNIPTFREGADIMKKTVVELFGKK